MVALFAQLVSGVTKRSNLKQSGSKVSAPLCLRVLGTVYYLDEETQQASYILVIAPQTRSCFFLTRCSIRAALIVTWTLQGLQGATTSFHRKRARRGGKAEMKRVSRGKGQEPSRHHHVLFQRQTWTTYRKEERLD